MKKITSLMTSMCGWLPLLGLVLPLSVHATDVVVADANGNELTYSYDSADGPATFKAVKTYATDADKAGHIIIADNVTDANNVSHEVKYISGSVGNRGNIVSIVFGQNIVATGGPTGESSDAFYNCKNLTSVTLNAKLEILGNYTFQGCNALTDINLEDAVNLTTIRRQALEATALTALTIPATVTTTGYRAFSNMAALKTVTVLGSIESFDGGFGGTNNVETISCYGEKVPGNFYKGTTSLTTLTFGPGVKTIGDYAFQNNSGLTTINFDAGITGLTIGNYAFHNADKVTTLNLPAGLKSIGNDAFYNLDLLRTVTFAEGCQVETLGEFAFEDNYVLESINLESCTQLTEIKRNALENCRLLKTITIPASVTTFGGSIFAYTDSIETFTFLAENVPGSIYAGRQKLKTVNIGPGVKTIGNEAFRNNYQLENINIDPAVNGLTIGNYAFQNADKVTTLNLPKGVIAINYAAFDSMNLLSMVNFTDDSELTTLGNYAFSSCPMLSAFTLPASLTTFSSNILSSSNNIKTFTVLCAEVSADLYRDRPSLYTVNIGPGVKKLGSACFYNSKGLKQLNISDDVSDLVIGESAFSECDSLTSIYLPAGVTKLERYAFYSIDCLTSMTFAEGSGITEIPQQCFHNCWNLETIKLPNSVQKIGYRAFWYCSALKEVYFGTGFIDMGTDAYPFGSCDKIEKIVLPGVTYPFKTNFYVPADAILYVHPDLVETYRTTDYTKNYHIMAIGSTTDYAVTTTAGGQLQSKVPEDIAQYALSLTVNGPLNGTDINYLHSAFPCLQVLNLKNARIVAGGDKYNQWNVAQNGTATVNTYYGPWDTEDDVVGYAMFYNMPSLTSLSLPNGTTKIGAYAVAQDQRRNLRLAKVDIPASVTEIGRYAFYYAGITEVTVPAGVTRLEEYTFHRCEKLQKATLPDGITFIGYACFADDYALEDVNIPASVETIDTYAFNENHKRSTPAVIPNTCKTIGYHAFYNNYELTSVTFGNSLESIGEGAFANCHKLESAVLPETITSLGSSVFYDCDSLRSFTFPQNITEVPPHFLHYCDGLESVILAAGTTRINYEAFADCPKLSSVNITPDMPLTYIGNYGFDDTALTSMILPNTITDMGYSVFCNCHQLKSVNVPTGMDRVPYNYCYNCENLTDVQMHDGIRTIQHEAFLGCSSLETIDLNDQITSIEYRAFQGCSKLNLPKLPDALTKLEYAAFHQTPSFTTVLTIPAGVNYIGDDCFHASAIRGVVMHDGITLGGGVFRNNDSLRTVRLPQDLKILPHYTFYHCDSLKYVDLPEGLEEIRYNCFDLSGLTAIDLPESVQYLGDYALASCQLRDFRMPDGYASNRIGSYVVAYNYKLETAHLGRNLDYTVFTDMSTFYRCDSLKLLRIYAATPPGGRGNLTFRKTCVLEVPEGSEDLYRATDYWKEFKEIRGFFTGNELAEADFAVLKELYENLDGTTWATSWNLEDNHNPNGKWPGVYTAPRGSETSLIHGITDIDLSSMGLTGELPASVFRLKDLKTLNLSNNHISGNPGAMLSNIPEAKRAPLTTVNLRANNFSGDLYEFASALPTMTDLNVSYNRFTDVSQAIDKSVLKNLNLEMQFIDYTTKQAVSDLPDSVPVTDINVGEPAAIVFPTTFTYRHSQQDFGRNPSNLIRPYCYNFNYNYWGESWELAKNGEGLWDIDTYDTRVLQAPKDQLVAYEYNWQTVLLRFHWDDGDVNADQQVDVTDLMSVVNFAFNERKYSGERFNYTDADVNVDSKIDVIDIVGNVERILAHEPAASRSRIINKVEGKNAPNVIETTGMVVALNNAEAVAALQLTVAGATQGSVTIADELKGQFTIAMRQCADGLRVVVYSTDGRTLPVGQHTLLSELPAGAVVVDACLSDAAANRLAVSILNDGTTGVQSVATQPQQTDPVEVYDLGGRRLDTDWQSLPSGIYVVRSNGKQYKVKK